MKDKEIEFLDLILEIFTVFSIPSNTDTALEYAKLIEVKCDDFVYSLDVENTTKSFDSMIELARVLEKFMMQCDIDWSLQIQKLDKITHLFMDFSPPR